MPEPICSTSYAKRSGLCSEDGNTTEQEQARQRPSLARARAIGGRVVEEIAHEGWEATKEAVTHKGAEHVAVHAFTRLGLHRAVAWIEKTGGPVAMFAALGYAGTKLAGSTILGTVHEDKERLLEARLRDGANAALAMVIQSGGDVLPAGFATAVERAVPGHGLDIQSRAQLSASRVLSDADNGVDGAVALRDGVRGSAREGMAFAYRQHLDSDEAIARARTSPEFEKRWNEDPAFRLGVLGAIWQATFDAAAFEQATALNAQLRAQVRP